MIMVSSAATGDPVGGGSRLAVVVTVAKGYDLAYIWKTQGGLAGRTAGGYYINAAQNGEPPGLWWGSGAQALGFHGTRVDGREPGRFEPAGLIVTSWLQGTSRDGDPKTTSTTRSPASPALSPTGSGARWTR
jgi:hypothetical protein